MIQLTQAYIKTNGIILHVVQAGPVDGPLVLLLHGFPEYWRGWCNQIDALAAAGYWVWAPDQRGYNLSDKPQGIAAYNLDELAADAVGLIDAAGRETAVLVGHDWGAAVAWWTANKYPQRLRKLVILNVPHHAVMSRHLRQNKAQKRKSWYMFFFQLPWLPEAMIRAGNWWGGVRSLQASSRPGAFSAADLDGYRQAWSQPGALTAMLNWYRAMFRARPQPVASPKITVPTRLIWGAQDKFLGREMAQPSIELCANGRLHFIEEASHWVQHEEPEQVNKLLLDFI